MCTLLVFRQNYLPHTWLYLSDCLYGRAMLQKQLHHLDSVLLAGNVQRSETILQSIHKKRCLCVRKGSRKQSGRLCGKYPPSFSLFCLQTRQARVGIIDSTVSSKEVCTV